MDSLQWLAEQGCTFALPFGRTKNKFEMDWPNKPHGLSDAIKHAKGGGNVGILTGKHSDNIVALDRDVNFTSTVAMLGDLGKTAKIVRSNAPERGKLLYRISGDLPPTVSWKPEGEKHPHAEFLGDNGQRHALCPPSMIDGGEYQLLDAEFGVQTITPNELDYIWRLITGGSIYKDVRAQEEAEAAKQAKDEYVKSVKSAWTVTTVFEHFNKAKNGTAKERGETRILGNGGLLISADGDVWFDHSDSIGGDSLDAWAWCKWGKRVDRSNPKMFWDTLDDMGAAKGIIKPLPGPKLYTNGNGANGNGHTTPLLVEQAVESKTTKPEKKTLSTQIKEDYADLGYVFALNECSQEIFVTDVVLDESMAASIRVAMRDLGYKNVSAFEDVYIAEAGKHRFHPIKRYFESLQWDGQNHILALSKYLRDNHEWIPGPHDTARPVSHVWLLRWLIGAVAKVMKPGSQNAMLVLAGAQDAGKSTFALWLCSPLPDLHEESSIDPENKEHIRKLASKFIWEVSELGATTRKADVESLKAFITQMDVTYRVPYSKHAVTVPATASFIGTINPTSEGFLNDETGSRRFLILDLVELDWGYAQNIDINQVWAQALHLYKSGEPWRLTPAEIEIRKEINKVHEIVDSMEDFFKTYYIIDPTKSDEPNWQIDPTNIIEHLRFKNFKDGDKQLSTRMGITLKRLGVERRRPYVNNVQVRIYVGIKLKQ
jgi:predicted P-loop ATPase